MIHLPTKFCFSTAWHRLKIKYI